jgi:hypothetical protein
VFIWAKVNERYYGGYPLSQATLRVTKDPAHGTIDITVNDPSFTDDPALHGGGLTLRRDDAIWLANALLLALGRKKGYIYSRHSKDRTDGPAKPLRTPG